MPGFASWSWARTALFWAVLLGQHGDSRLAHGKAISAYIQTSLRQFSDIYLGQFTFDKGGGKIVIRTLANVRGQRFLFFDGRAESWPTVLATYQSLSCNSLKNVSLMVTEETGDSALSEGLVVPFGKYKADLQLSPTPEPAQWYTMLSNCDDVIDIDFVLTLLNPGGWWYAHFSVDEQGLLGMFVGWTLIYSATVLLFVFSQIKSLDKERGVHPFMALLSAALMLEYVGIVCQTWHGWTYATDGEGLVVLQAVGEVLDACSNLVIMLLLLMMARGWTVSSAAQSVHSRHFSKDWIVSMSLFMTGFLSLFILERTGRAIDARYCYDSDIGLLALMLRNAVFIYFIISLLRSYRIEESAQRRRFLVLFGVISSVWFLALPIAYYSAQFLPVWDQMKVVIAVSTAVHSCGLILLAILVMPDAVSKDYIILHPSLDQEGQRTHSTPYDDI